VCAKSLNSTTLSHNWKGLIKGNIYFHCGDDDKDKHSIGEICLHYCIMATVSFVIKIIALVRKRLRTD